MSILEQKRVLQLNANWQPLRTVSVHDAFIRMSRVKRAHYTKEQKRPYFGVHIEYPFDENGNIDFSQQCGFYMVQWDDWIQLPPRPFDAVIQSASKAIRVPTVIIANNYRKIPEKYPRYSKNGVWKRDNYTCQLTGEKLTKATGNIDHITPRSEHGESSFRNCYLVKQELNSKRGNMPLHEFCRIHGFKVPQPKEPENKVVIQNQYNIPDWDLFINK